jgi:hypothetical protein
MVSARVTCGSAMEYRGLTVTIFPGAEVSRNVRTCAEHNRNDYNANSLICFCICGCKLRASSRFVVLYTVASKMDGLYNV